MTVSAIGAAIIEAIVAGMGVIGDFCTNLATGFTNVFFTVSDGATTGLSNVGVVGLIMLGFSIVTGVSMMVFKKLFHRL